jgi:hypothetical protein
MAIDRNDTDERQARLDAMIEEFRAAQQRRLDKRESLMNRGAGVQRAVVARVPAPPYETRH